MKRINFYKTVSQANACLFAYLFIQSLFSPAPFIADLGIQPNEAAIIILRRAAMFMLGIGLLSFFTRDLPPSKMRNYICLSTGTTMIGLATTGCYELIKGTVSLSILPAIIIEIIIGFSFLAIFFMERRPNGTI